MRTDPQSWKRLNQTTSWQRAPIEARRRFIAAMSGNIYSYNALSTAWVWFNAGFAAGRIFGFDEGRDNI